MTDRPPTSSHGARQGHSVHAGFLSSLPVTPRTSRSGSPSALLANTSPAYAMVNPATVKSAFGSASAPADTYDAHGQRQSLNMSTSSSALTNLPQPRWDTQQQSVNSSAGNFQNFILPAMMAPSSDSHFHHRSYSLDSGIPTHQQSTHATPHHNEFFTPRVPIYDANSFGTLGPPPGLMSSPLPPTGKGDQWISMNAGTTHTATRSPPKRGQKKADGKQPTFLIKLYDFLEQPSLQHIMRWDETGEFIIIERSRELLPHFGKMSHFASFTRQLNLYGWMRKHTSRQGDNASDDPNAGPWAHPTLRRGSSKEELHNIRRRVGPRLTSAQKRARMEALSSVGSEPDNFPAQDLHHQNWQPRFDDDDPASGVYFPPLQVAGGVSSTYAGNSQHGAQVLNRRHPVAPSVELQSRRQSYPPTFPPPYTGVQYQEQVARSPTYPARMGNDNEAVSEPTPAPSSPSASVMPADDSSFQGTQAGYPSSFTSGSISPPVALGALWIGDDEKDEGLLRGTQGVPACLLDDVSTWQRSGLGILGNGIRPSEPAPLQASSLPNDLPSFHQLGYTSNQQASPWYFPLPYEDTTTSQTSTARLAKLASPQQALAPLRPETVSPGAYQTAFVNESTGSHSPASSSSPVLSQAPLTPPLFASRVPKSPTTTRHVRRLSASKAPYGNPPRSHVRSNSTPSSGNVRTVDGRRVSLAPVNTTRPFSGDSDGLPSASLPGQPELFNGEFNDIN